MLFRSTRRSVNRVLPEPFAPIIIMRRESSSITSRVESSCGGSVSFICCRCFESVKLTNYSLQSINPPNVCQQCGNGKSRKIRIPIPQSCSLYHLATLNKPCISDYVQCSSLIISHLQVNTPKMADGHYSILLQWQTEQLYRQRMPIYHRHKMPM